MGNKESLSNVLFIKDLLISGLDINPKIIADMTMGNGNDSYKLLEAFPKAKLFAFDIQDQALVKTREKLNNFDEVSFKLIKDSHENIDKYIDRLDIFIFNFGYLPGSDKTITTLSDSSLRAVKKALELLRPLGIGFMVFYPGHKEGRIEYELAKEYLAKLDQKLFNVFEINMINQASNPAILIGVEKRK